MKCPICNTENENFKYCTNCGYKLDVIDEFESPIREKNNNRVAPNSIHGQSKKTKSTAIVILAIGAILLILVSIFSFTMVSLIKEKRAMEYAKSIAGNYIIDFDKSERITFEVLDSFKENIQPYFTSENSRLYIKKDNDGFMSSVTCRFGYGQKEDVIKSLRSMFDYIEKEDSNFYYGIKCSNIEEVEINGINFTHFNYEYGFGEEYLELIDRFSFYVAELENNYLIYEIEDPKNLITEDEVYTFLNFKEEALK